MPVLRIYFSDTWRDSTSACPWAVCDDQGTVLQSGSSPLAAMPKGHECIAILAADRVTSIAAVLPPRARQRWQSILPFLVEEHVLTDPEESHIVPAETLPDGRRVLALTNKPWLKRIVDATEAAQLSLRQAVPEFALGTLPANTWLLVWNGREGFIRTGVTSSNALDSANGQHAPAALQLYTRSIPPPNKIALHYTTGTPNELRLAHQWQGLPAPLEVSAEDWDWKHTPIPSDAPNLLWGAFAPRARVEAWWPHLRPLVIILAAALFIEMLGSHIEWGMLAYQKHQLSKNIERTFRTAFGDSAPMVNAPLQMQRHLAELRHNAGLPDDGDFLPLLDRAAPGLSSLPKDSISSLHYEAGRLDIELTHITPAQLSELKTAWSRQNLGVRSSDLQDEGDHLNVKLILSSDTSS